MRPVCVTCGKFMKPHCNGRCVLVMSDGAPYQIWMADEWKCEQCHAAVVVGFAREPLSEHFMDDFEAVHSREQGAGNLVVAV